MKHFDKHLIHQDASVIEAMKKLGDVPKNLTLFVHDSAGRVVGAVTDGDIRRGFIKGRGLDEPVSEFMMRVFHSINDHAVGVREISLIRNKGIQLLPVLDQDQRIVKVYDLNQYRSVLPVDCVIMAGGRGERLRPLTDKMPKPLLPIGNKPIIEHNIDRLISFGIDRIYISLRYLGQHIVDYLGDGSAKGIQIEYIWEEKPLGTAGALSLIPEFHSDYVLLMNSDLFTDVDFEDLYLQVTDQAASMGIASFPYTVNIPYAIFSEDSRSVKGFEEKPTQTNYANAGIYLFAKEWIGKIPRNSFYDITDLLQTMIDAEAKIIHNPIVGYWIDIGKHEDYENAQEIVKHLKNYALE